MIEPMFDPINELPRRQRGPVRAQLVPAALLVLAGVAAGAVWRLSIPFFLDHSDQQEAAVAVQGGLALVVAVAGLLVAIGVVVRPGTAPAIRTALAIVGSFVAAVLAWWTGELLGAAKLTTPAVLLVWPVMTSVVIFLFAMLPITGDRLNAH